MFSRARVLLYHVDKEHCANRKGGEPCRNSKSHDQTHYLSGHGRQGLKPLQTFFVTCVAASQNATFASRTLLPGDEEGGASDFTLLRNNASLVVVVAKRVT